MIGRKTIVDNITLEDESKKRAFAKVGQRLWAVYGIYSGGSELVTHGSIFQIWIAYSNDKGKHWTGHTQLTSGTGHQRAPCMAVDSQGNLHIVWYGRGVGTYPTQYQIRYIQRTTSGWGEIENLSDVNAPQMLPGIAVDSKDDVHVVWYGRGWGTNTNYNNIQYIKKSSGVWQAQETITDIDKDQYDATLAIDGNDDIHVVWEGQGWGLNSGWDNIQYRKRTSSGWQTQESVTDVVGYFATGQLEPSIAIDADGDVHVAWNGRWNGEVVVRIHYIKRTTTWGSAEHIDPDYGDGSGPEARRPSLSLSLNKHIHIVWNRTGDESGIYYRKKIGDTWGSIEKIYCSDPDLYYSDINVVALNAYYPIIGGVHTNMTNSGIVIMWDANDSTRLDFYSTEIPFLGNPNIDQLIYQHAERMQR